MLLLVAVAVVLLLGAVALQNGLPRHGSWEDNGFSSLRSLTCEVKTHLGTDFALAELLSEYPDANELARAAEERGWCLRLHVGAPSCRCCRAERLAAPMQLGGQSVFFATISDVRSEDTPRN